MHLKLAKTIKDDEQSIPGFHMPAGSGTCSEKPLLLFLP